MNNYPQVLVMSKMSIFFFLLKRRESSINFYIRHSCSSEVRLSDLCVVSSGHLNLIKPSFGHTCNYIKVTKTYIYN